MLNRQQRCHNIDVSKHQLHQKRCQQTLRVVSNHERCQNIPNKHQTEIERESVFIERRRGCCQNVNVMR